MGIPMTVPTDLSVSGNISCTSLNPKQITLPDDCVDDDQIPPAAGIQANKCQQQYVLTHRQAGGTDVVTKTELLHIVHGPTGAVIAIYITVIAPPVTSGAPSTDKKFTVDIQKGNQTTGYATILTGVVTIANTTAARQVVSGTLLASPTTASGDSLIAIVTASGSTGSQAQGVIVEAVVREDAGS